MQDTIKRGAIAGFAGTWADFFIHIGSMFLIGTTTTAHYISRLIFPDGEMNRTRFFIAEMAHFMAGSAAGVLYSLMVRSFGEDNFVTKSLGLGALLWVVHILVIPNAVRERRPNIWRNEKEAIVDLASLLGWGITTAVVFNRLDSKRGLLRLR